jgi:serine/threonine protein phosphatase PrpC
MMSVQWGSATDPGRVRASNEDSYLVAPNLFVVADGMGGHAAGEVASAIAVGEFRALAEQPELRVEAIAEAIARANQHILHSGTQHETRAGMGTTLAGLGVVRAGGSAHWAVFNVGDSRVYHYVHGELHQVSVDHSEVQDLISAGYITPDEAKTHPDRNVVTRSLGTDPAPVPDMWVFPPVAGERFLICSDGLPRELDDDEIKTILYAETVAQQAATALVARAVEAGGHDNITAVVIDFAGSMADGLAHELDEDTAPRRHGLVGF